MVSWLCQVFKGILNLGNGDLLTSDGLIEHKVKFYDLNDTGTTNEITYRIDAHTVLRDTSYWGNTPSFYEFNVRESKYDFQTDGTKIEIPHIFNNNLWYTLNHLHLSEITKPVSIEWNMPRTDYSFNLPFNLTNKNDLFDVNGLDFTVNMLEGDDEATVYQDYGEIDGGIGSDKVNFATVSKSSSTVNYISGNSYEIIGPSGNLPGRYLLENVEFIKFADETEYHEIENYVNIKPEIVGQLFASTVENLPISEVIHTVEAYDQNGDALTFFVTGSDASYVTINNDGEIKLINSPDYETKSEYIFDVTVSDGFLSDTKSVSIEVLDLYEAPKSDTTEIFESEYPEDIQILALLEENQNQYKWGALGTADTLTLVLPVLKLYTWSKV